MKPLPKLYLASTSPRRKQLFEALGLSFEILNIEVEEQDPSIESVEKGAIANAEKKALAGLQKAVTQNALIVSADTVVAINDQVLGKPKTPNDVLKMLSSLSGNTHRVVTGMVLLQSDGEKSASAVSSLVTFKKLSLDDIKSYSEIREPYDKAGSYAIQGLGARFIEKIEGSYTNIMGFPIEKFLEELPVVSGISIFKWFVS